METQCGWKPPTASHLNLFFNKKLIFTIFLYWCSLIPVHSLLPAKGYNLLSFSSFSWKGATTPLALVLANHLLVCRCWPTECSNLHSFSSCYWKGATTPLALVLANVLVHRCRPTEGYNLLFLPPGTTFHKFSDWILMEHNIIIWRPHFIQFSYWNHQYHWSTQSINTSIINLWITQYWITETLSTKCSHQNTE